MNTAAGGQGILAPSVAELDAIAADRDIHINRRHMAAGWLALLTGKTAAIVASRYELSAGTIGHARVVADRATAEEAHAALDGRETVSHLYVQYQGDGRHRARPRLVRSGKAVSSDNETRLRYAHEQSQYEAMTNAPRGAVNIPMLNRASKVARLLEELEALDAEDAATMMPAMRVREFSDTAHLGEWWVKFAAACDERRKAEIPDMGHQRRPGRRVV